MKTATLLSVLCVCGCLEAAQAPETFRVKFDTSKGPFVVEVHRSWSPNGADRFYELVQQKFFDETRFFRVVPGFIVQFGISGNPTLAANWRARRIPDDPVKQSNTRGTLCFAKGGPGSRTTQLFINLANNERLDASGFAAFGRVVDGMNVVDEINSEYGESPQQARIQAEGNVYLKAKFPRLDYIKTARLE